ncbi:MAG: CHAT domain-containing protein, partial [Haliscomenobacteraceae bacterium CHB4]|nr:CHAT domain-containing protein [Haliscomenobacteraceae bacterium CHB4]
MAFNMKTIVFCLSVFFVLFWENRVEAQVVDSAAVVREVDSLINVVKNHIAKREFDKALDLNNIAGNITLANLGKESVAYGKVCFNFGNILKSKRDIAEAEKWYLLSISIFGKTLGKENIDYVKCLNNLGLLYREVGDYEKSEAMYIESMNIRERIVGKEHPDYATSVVSLANLYNVTGNYEKAEPLYLEAKSIRGNVLGKEHPDYAAVLNNLSVLYKAMGKYEKAEPIILEVISIREKILGKDHPDYAMGLNNLANLYRVMGNYKRSEPLHLEAISIRAKMLGKDHPDYATGLNNLANLYRVMGNYENSELLHLEAKSIRERVLGKEHSDYAQSLNNLANLYTDMGDYEKAEKLHLESKAIREKAFGKNHREYAESLLGLANLYIDMGNYERVEDLYLEAKVIWEDALGKEHPDYLVMFNTLANLYLKIGNYKKAEPLYLGIKTIWDKFLDKRHPDYILTLNNIANLYSDMGNFEKAESLLLETKEICEKVLGKEHPNYAFYVGNLAVLYCQLREYKKAEIYFLESKRIQEKTIGKEHPDYASSLNNLGGFYKEIGDYGNAEPLLLEARAIWGRSFGKEHPKYAMASHNLAGLYRALGKYEKVESLYDEYVLINQIEMEKAANYLTEQELQNYAILNAILQDEILSFPLSTYQKKTGNSKTCFRIIILYKGFLLNAVNHLKGRALSDSTTTEQLRVFKSYGRRLAQEYSKPIAERDSVYIVNLEAKSEVLEKELSRSVAGFADARREVTWDQVRDNLQKGEAAIEFTHFQYYDQKDRITDSTFYAALILLPSDTAPHYIPLFEQTQLSTLLSKTQNSAQSVGNLYAAARSGIVLDEIPAYGTELYNLIWKPLDSLLQGVKTVYFSPSGLLHRVNLAAIPVDSTAVLADKYTLRQMSSTRNLVVKTPEPVPAGYTAALFGGIRYNSDSTALYDAAIAMRGAGDEMSSRSTLEYTSDVQRDTAKVWTYLEGTRTEVDSLQRQMQHNGLNVKIFTGLAATEESFKALGRDTVKSPDILHIATHGFFFDDPEKRREQRFGDENVFRWNENPLFRSGLILAGADHAWQTGRPYANLEDGICTAYEISHLNLSNTKLAVLSACETGLGDIKGSEGVYGLQRAFKMAGVDYLIV